METQRQSLESYMKNLLAAGLDIQTVLAQGLAYSMADGETLHHDLCDRMYFASHLLATTARKLHIDRESQLKAARDTVDDIRRRSSWEALPVPL